MEQIERMVIEAERNAKNHCDHCGVEVRGVVPADFTEPKHDTDYLEFMARDVWIHVSGFFTCGVSWENPVIDESGTVAEVRGKHERGER